MDFFEQQARARAQSRRMLWLFALAVLAIVGAIDGVVLFALRAGTDPRSLPPPALPIVAATSLMVLAVIGLASFYRMLSLSSGGSAVARSLGANLVAPDTANPQQRRLRNVVEEIAIASGVPVPQIFVLEQESGINAFAAGHSPADAAITVTRGALDKLTRDELQGVIAHEFSHLLNGDMRLNIRLMGLLFGILLLAVIARQILYFSPRSDSRRDGGGIVLIAFAVMAFGYIGVFFGRLIKASVSRSREFLADASAVQFTRQTAGLAGALKKAAGIEAGTRLQNVHGEEVAHMLFGDGIGLSGLYATHPPLVERIRRLDPQFDPATLPAQAQDWNDPNYRAEEDARPPAAASADSALLGFAGNTTVAAPGAADSRFGGFAEARPGSTAGVDPESVGIAATAGPQAGVLVPAVVSAQVGRPGEDDYRGAMALHRALPGDWLAAARDDQSAVDVVLALLLDADPRVRGPQLQLVATQYGAQRLVAIEALFASRASLPPEQRLPLAALTLPSLRRRTRNELTRLMNCLWALVMADGRVEVFEWCLARLVRDQIAAVLAPVFAAAAGQRELRDARDAVLSLLAVLAAHGNPDPSAAQAAFDAGAAAIYPAGPRPPFVPPQPWTSVMDQALDQLDQLVPTAKRALIEALVILLSADGRVTVIEAELLRVVCGALHCPLPPLLQS